MTTSEHDPVKAAADVTTALRAWLRARREPSEVQAAALAYELAALVAKEAPTATHAFLLVDQWARTLKWQIHEFGVGREHP
jgi:hypothetical protein